MSISPTVSRVSVGALFNRFIGALTGKERTHALDDAIRARLNDGTEPSTALLLVTLNKMFGRQFNLEGFVASPADYHQQRGALPEARGYAPVGGAGGGAGLSQTNVGQSLVAALETEPGFREQLGEALGGTVLNNSTPDGNLLVLQVPASAPAEVGGATGQGQVLASMPMMAAAASGVGAPTAAPGMGPILGGLQQMEANVKSLALSISSKGEDAPPSGKFEDLQAKLMQTATSLGGQADISGGAKSDDEGDAKINFGEMPMGAGMMALADGGKGSAGTPLAQQNVTGALGGGGAGQQQMSDTMKQQMLQKMVKDLQKMYELLSNVIKSAHDMQKAAIDNLK